MRPNREPDAAGCLIVCPATCSILLLQRSSGVSHGGTWGIPGGGGETFDKDSAATALRETWEEAQLHPHLLGVVDVQPKKIGQFITYLATLPTEQAPTLNWEHSAYSWCPFDSQRGTWAFPGPLHSFRHGMSGLAATMANPGVVRAVLSACGRATPNPRPDFISTYYNVTTRQGPLPVIEPDRAFNRRVWSRIEALESPGSGGWDSLFSWLQLMARPQLAAAAVAIALFGGVMIGGLQAQGSQEQRYLRSLNPYASHR